MSGRAVIPERVRRLLPLLGSDQTGEITNACRLISRDLGTVGLDWHGVEIVPKVQGVVSTTPTSSPPDSASAPMPNFFDMARACRDVYGHQLNNWEFAFVGDMCRHASPTPKQMMRLSSIFARLHRRAA